MAGDLLKLNEREKQNWREHVNRNCKRGNGENMYNSNKNPDLAYCLLKAIAEYNCPFFSIRKLCKQKKIPMHPNLAIRVVLFLKELNLVSVYNHSGNGIMYHRDFDPEDLEKIVSGLK